MARPLWPYISRRELRCAEQADPVVLDQQSWQGQVAEDPRLRALGEGNPEGDVDDFPLVRPKEPVVCKPIGHRHGRLNQDRELLVDDQESRRKRPPG